MLQINNLKKSFGGIKAINNCSFNIQKNTINALIGPNGAGKTTIFNIISGLIKPDQGNILYKGKSIINLPPHKIASSGISRTFQLIRLFPKLTVLDNLLLAEPEVSEKLLISLFKRKFVKKEEQKAKEKCLNYLELVDMKDFSNTLAENLSYGQQKLVEIARSLATESELFLLDEPVAGINPLLREKLLNIIKNLKNEGKTILLIEHDMKFVLNIADNIVVLDHGEKIATGKPQDIKNNPLVLEAYLGEEIKI